MVDDLMLGLGSWSRFLPSFLTHTESFPSYERESDLGPRRLCTLSEGRPFQSGPEQVYNDLIGSMFPVSLCR